MNPIIIAGCGPSACQYKWPADVPILAVSGGYNVVPEIQHFVSLDKPMHFPKWLTDSDRFVKHVPEWKWAPYWSKCPGVRAWPYQECDEPTFEHPAPISSGPLLKSNVPDVRHNSLLFAVQLAPRLGFDTCVFIGCDLLPDGLLAVSDILKAWQPLAEAAGVRWENASPLSTLCEWMPASKIGEFVLA